MHDTSEHHTDIHSRRPAMNNTLDEQPETSAKRRKVRKGTQSCWECKRRKIRCTFATPEDVGCIGCQRRRTPCVSQEMPEDLSPAMKCHQHLSERIARVEDLMNDVIAGKHASATAQVEGEPHHDRPSNSDATKSCSTKLAPSSMRAALTPIEVRELPIYICRLS